MKTVSKIIEFPLTATTWINITITKKRMKNMRLSISKSGQVKVSIPNHTTYSYAYQFLVRKRSWIQSKLSKITSNLSKNSCNFVNNGNIFLLGHNFPLKVELSTKNKVIFNPTNLENSSSQNLNTIQTNDTNSQNTNYGFTIYIKENIDIQSIFIKWCKKYFLDFFTNRLNYFYSQMFKSNNPPTIKIKTMKSMWGNCNYVKKVITFNLYLSKAPINCIDYVIVHELAHLIHHNHSKQFHDLMTTLMPDWKERKKQLNNYSLNF